MYSNHVLEKDIETSEASVMDATDFANLITEKMLYRKMIDNHKMFMMLLALFHALIIFFTSLGVFYQTAVFEEKIYCTYADSIQNLSYVALNVLLAYFAISSIFKDKVDLYFDYIYRDLFMNFYIDIADNYIKYFPSNSKIYIYNFSINPIFQKNYFEYLTIHLTERH